MNSSDPDFDPTAHLDLEPDDGSDPDHIIHEIERNDWLEKTRAMWASEAASRKISPPPWLIEDMLLSQTFTMVTGEPFAGKSLFMLAIFNALSTGSPLAGLMPPSPRRCLFLGQDSPTWDYLGQFKKLALATRSEETTYNGSFLVLNRGYKLEHPTFQQTIKEAIEFMGVQVLMFDTLLEFHQSDENSNTEMQRIMSIFHDLRDRYRVSILFTTHTAKTSDPRSLTYRARGASVIAGSVDQHVHISRAENGFRVRVPKARGGETKADDFYIRFSASIIDGQKALGLDLAEAPTSRRQKTIEDILASGPKSRKEILSGLGIAYPEWSTAELNNRTSSLLRYLSIKGVIKKLERGMYGLPDSAEPKDPNAPA